MVRSILGAFLAASAVASSSADFGDKDRIYPGFHEKLIDQAQFYGKLENDVYEFKLVPRASKPVAESTVYFNLDQDLSTTSNSIDGPTDGFNFGMYGYELYAFITSSGVTMYSGCAPYNTDSCRQVVALPDSTFTLLADNSVEFSFSASLFEGLGAQGDIDVAVVLQSGAIGNTDVDQGPGFLLNYYTLYNDISTYLETPCVKEEGALRGAVLYDNLAKERYFLPRAYAQLYMSMQHQFRQAGMPHDLIALVDLLDIQTSCQYTAIVVPALTFLNSANWTPIKKALHILTQVYGVGLVMSGEVLSNQDDGNPIAGDPYYAMSVLLGIQNDIPVGAQTSETLVQVESTSELFWDRAVGDQVMDTDAAGEFVSIFKPYEDTAATVVRAAKQVLTINGVQDDYAAILTSQFENNIYGRSSGRMTHFSTAAVLANSDLVWRALVWISLENSPVHFGLQMTRFEGGIFTCRNDMDQSQFSNEAPTVSPALFERAIQPWYETYNFVASYYINIGNNSEELRETNWDNARAIYQQYIDLENEMGSHSYTHPSDINLLTDQDLAYEFGTSAEEIATELSLSRIAAAQPGNPEFLRVSKIMENYFLDTYFSGGISTLNAGYPGAFGFLDTESDMVYVAPNMFFDFSLTLLGVLKAEMGDFWKNEIDRLSEFAGSQVYHWPVHDYSVTEWDDTNLLLDASDLYQFEAFDETIAYAASKNVEFITTMQLSDRIRSSKEATVKVSGVTESTATVEVSMATTATSEITLGHHAVKLESPGTERFITRAGSHFAYDGTRLFVPSGGGSFDIEFGDAAALEASQLAVSRITNLDMRMELLSVSGNGQGLQFEVRGKGSVVVSLQQDMTEVGTVVQVSENGGLVADWENQKITFTFDTVDTHSVVISINAAPPTSEPPTTAPPTTVPPTTVPPTTAPPTTAPPTTAPPTTAPPTTVPPTTVPPTTAPPTTAPPTTVPPTTVPPTTVPPTTAPPTTAPPTTVPPTTAPPTTAPPTTAPPTTAPPTTVPPTTAPPTSAPADGSCIAECEDESLYESASITEDDSCYQIMDITNPTGSECGCDLSIDGAINSDASIDLQLACPDIQEDVILRTTALNPLEKLRRACAQYCGAEPGCSRWSFNSVDRVCYMYACSGEVSMNSETSSWASGTPCRPLGTTPQPSVVTCDSTRRWTKTYVKSSDKCTEINEETLVHRDSKTLGCDLSIDGSINDDGTLDLYLACPNIEASFAAFEEAGLTDTLDRYKQACAQFCGIESACTHWSMNKNDKQCILHSCTTDVPTRTTGKSAWETGVACIDSSSPTSSPTVGPPVASPTFVTPPDPEYCPADCNSEIRTNKRVKTSKKNCALINDLANMDFTPCGCDLTNRKAVSNKGVVNLKKACPDHEFTQEAFGRTCSILCADQHDCAQWSVDKKGKCYMYSCSGSVQVKNGKKWFSGYPCQESG